MEILLVIDMQQEYMDNYEPDLLNRVNACIHEAVDAGSWNSNSIRLSAIYRESELYVVPVVLQGFLGLKNHKMKIYLLDNNPVICKTWNLYFEGEREVEVVCDDFKYFMDTTDVECVVSPANSFGIMDGGYDLAISEWLEWKQQDLVQDYIKKIITESNQ